jgi:formylglycine-generating enzyme required for sulfatase activity
MSQIFFSYSRKDSASVDQLIEQLEQRGVDVWVDRGDLLAGEAWRSSIVEAIINCKVFVIVLSPNSVESENVAKELTLAEQYKKRVLPLVLEEVKIPPSLDYQLAGLHYQTFEEGRYEENFDRLVRALGALGIVFAPKAALEPKLEPEPAPEHETIPVIPEPSLTTEIEERQASAPARSQPEPQTPQPDMQARPEFSAASSSTTTIGKPAAHEAETGPLKKIPLWLWVGGGLVVIVGLVIGFSAILGGDTQNGIPTATDEIAIVLPATNEAVIVTSTSELTPTPYPPQITDDFDVPMVLIPAGSFMMGTDREDALKECQNVNPSLNCAAFYFGDEEPERTMDLDDDYYIDQYEVTNERYDACVSAGACEPPWNFDLVPGVAYFRVDEYAQYPVVNVTWDAAKAYCEWRGGRLPTEAEWEKAARSTGDARLYPWGDAFGGGIGNFCDANCGNSWANHSFNDGYTYTAPVGSFSSSASPNGVEDMAGNVSEWVDDLYGPYPGGEADVESDFYGETRVRRGGSWYSLGSDLRVSRRDKNLPAPQVVHPNSELGKIGFRCVFDVP